MNIYLCGMSPEGSGRDHQNAKTARFPLIAFLRRHLPVRFARALTWRMRQERLLYLPSMISANLLLILLEKGYNNWEKDFEMHGKSMTSSFLKPEIFMPVKIVKPLRTFLSERQEILLAFLYGSFVSKRMRPSSDVDIGILFNSVPEMDAINEVTEELSSILQREIDLAVLNHASPVLKMQILKKGILLYARDKKHLYRFFVDTVNQYDDLKQIRKTCEENILRGRIYAR
jgi:uncharacterized protein